LQNHRLGVEEAEHNLSSQQQPTAAERKSEARLALRGEIDEVTDELDAELMRFLIDTRRSMKISQRELSKMSGVNQSNLSKIENGLITPSLGTLQKVAACLGHKVVISFVPN